jgi:hypothetical protein
MELIIVDCHFMRAICKNAKDWMATAPRRLEYDQTELKRYADLPTVEWVFGQDPYTNSETKRNKMCPKPFKNHRDCPEKDQPDIYPGPWYTTKLSKEVLGASYEIMGKYDAQGALVERSGLM